MILSQSLSSKRLKIYLTMRMFSKILLFLNISRITLVVPINSLIKIRLQFVISNSKRLISAFYSPVYSMNLLLPDQELLSFIIYCYKIVLIKLKIYCNEFKNNKNNHIAYNLTIFNVLLICTKDILILSRLEK